MSRSIGDGECKQFGVICDPLIKQFSVSPSKSADDEGDRFVIVASDGVWEFMESQEACDIVSRNSKSAQEACQALVQEAKSRWTQFEINYRDDITAAVIFLPVKEATFEEVIVDSMKANELDLFGDGTPYGEEYISESNDVDLTSDFAARRLSTRLQPRMGVPASPRVSFLRRIRGAFSTLKKSTGAINLSSKNIFKL